jgi:putative DNA primase/helicase
LSRKMEYRDVKSKEQTQPTLSRKRQALRYAAHGCLVLPLYTTEHRACSCAKGESCSHPGKHPKTPNGVNDATKDRVKIKARHWSDANIGVATGIVSDIFVVDVDGESGEKTLESLQAKHGQLRKTVTVSTGKGRHLYFRCGGARVGNSVGTLGDGLDVRGDGGYVVGAGSRHQSGRLYRFVGGKGLDEIEVARAPKWLLKLVTTRTAENNQPEFSPIPPEKMDRAKAYADVVLRLELDRLGKAPQHQRNDTLNRAAFKLGQLMPYAILDGQKVTADLARVAREIGLDDSEVNPTITSGLNAGSRYPRRLPFLKSNDRIKSVEPPEKSNQELAVALASLRETDTDNAQRFAWRFGAKVLYTPGHGWLAFDGKRWLPDQLGQVVELAKETARRIADEAQHLSGDEDRLQRSKFAVQSQSKGSLDRMLDLAKSLLSVQDKRLDADPWLLNVENGTIDLRTGRREKHDHRDLLTKIAPLRADRRAKCPLFKKFLKRITGDDADLRTFIQKAVGYSLTGDMSEQAFFFVYGRSGNNGKSTLVNLIRKMLGDYGCHTQTETLLVKQYDNNIPADLARLEGARMVTAIEANVNRQIDEAKIKGMTGGEPITARFMRQNFFEFTPEFKLWLVANDQPRVRGTDEAFWRRVRVIPLTIKIPMAERDGNLPNKFRMEWPGILEWAVRGCRKWQREGLGQPAIVRSATKGWQQAMDHLKKFIVEEVDIAPGCKIAASQLMDRYKKWCVQHGEQSLTVQDFTAKLKESHDVTHTRIKGRSWWRGIKFRD